MSTLYSKSKPRRADITGAADQVYSFPGEMVDSICRSIIAGHVSAIGTADINLNMCYITCPQVHTDLAGVPRKIIGCGSNEMGEFTLVVVDLYSLGYFVVVSEEAVLPPGMGGVIDISAELLKETSFSAKTVRGALMPNWIPFYYGKDLPYGSLEDDVVKNALTSHGPGYTAWTDAVILNKDLSDDIMSVIDAATSAHSLEECFGRACSDDRKVPREGRRSLTSNGHFGTVTIAQSKAFPVEAAVIKPLFITASVNSTVAGSQTVVLRTPDHDAKEVEALQGQAKLSLFFTGGVVDFAKGTIENVTYAHDSPCMKNIYENQRTARASMLVDLLTTAFKTARAAGPLDTRSRQATMRVIGLTLSKHMMSGNFSQIRLTDIFNEHTSLDPTAFLPQKNSRRVQQAKDEETRLRNEGIADIAADQKERAKTSLQLIGDMDSVEDFSCLMVNSMTICDSVINNATMVAAGGGSVFRQILMSFALFVNDEKFSAWVDDVGHLMAHLPWSLFGYFESIWIHVAKFATDYNNVNVFRSKRPTSDLDITELKGAVMIAHLAMDHFRRHFATATPDTSIPRLCPSSKKDSSDNKRPVPAAAAAARGDTDDESPAQVPKKPRQKKKRALKSDAEPFDRKTRGMFFLKDPTASAADIFPRGLLPMPCAFFTCCGKECFKSTKECVHKHFIRPKELDMATIETIGDHFLKTKKGWFSAAAFAQYDLKPKYKALLGDKSGPFKAAARSA